MRRVSWSQAFGRESPVPDSKSISPSQAFGAKKSITYWGGICLLSNNLTGPGMVLLPGLFAGAGFTFPFVVTVLIAVLSSLSVLFLAKTIQSIPGNSGFSQRVEFSKLIRRLFPKWLYACAFFAMIFNLQAANIGAIIVSAQTMDSTLLAIFKKTCAMTVFSPSWTSIGAPANAGIVDRNGTSPSPIFQCILNDNNDVNTDSPFGADYVISMGFLIVLVLCVPLGYFNLEDNIWVQQFGFFFLVLCLIAWVFQFFYSGMDVNRLGVLVPRPGTTTAFGSVLSVIIFQFNFALYVPSWLIEKRPDVSVGKSVFWAVVISSAMFLVLGILGALAYDYPAGQDFLAVLSSQSTSKQMLPTSLIGAYLFPAAALLTGIPVASIVIRYNLVESKLCGTFAANFNGVVLPWLLALCFFAGSFLNSLIQWTSALVFVALNLAMPVYMYIITHVRDVKSEVSSGPINNTDFSFQNFGNALMSPDYGESLLGNSFAQDEPEIGKDCSVEASSVVIPKCIAKLFKLPRNLLEQKLSLVVFYTSVILGLACFALQVFSAASGES